MAITSISRIQHRRGLKTDLPNNLNEGELGWCIDTRELYIGNGQTYGGNTQLLSDKTPNTDIITHTYRGNSVLPIPTGATPATPIVRTLGSIIDDWVSVKDFGAVGDGIADDTAAINRAIANRWTAGPPPPYPYETLLSAIRFPAGVYKITSPIDIYPYTVLIGDGPEISVIKLANGSSNSAMRTADSFGEVGSNIGQNGADLPQYITISNLSIDTSADAEADCIRLNRATNVLISNVKMVGAWKNYTSESSGIKAIWLRTFSPANISNNITIQNADISGYVHGLYCSDPVSYITMQDSFLYGLWQGITLGVNAVSNGPSYVKLINNQIKNIDDSGLIVLSGNPGITSTNNVYDTVGDWNNVNPIFFDTNTVNCSSINDFFTRAETTRISLGNPLVNLYISAQQTSITSNAPITAGPITLQNNVIDTPTGIAYDSSIYNTVFINYSIKRDTARRAGTLTLVTDGSTATLDDMFVNHNGTVDVSFSVAVSGGAMVLRYTTTNTGFSGTMRYIETKWLS